MSTCLDELGKISDRSRKLREEFLKDGRIDADEQRRLDALSQEWDRARDACLAKAQAKIDKTAADAGARFTVDPSQLKAFKETVKKMSNSAQVAAADVLNILLALPPPADAKASKEMREKIREAFRLVFAGEKMAIGRELNKLGIYIPSLKEDAPGAEDATARIKKIRMASYDWGVNNPQKDYVRDMLAQAKDKGFKISLQVKGSAAAKPTKDLENKAIVDRMMEQIAKDLPTSVGATEADRKKYLQTYLEILPADEDDWVWSEDNKWLSVDGNTIRRVPDISKDTIRNSLRFSTARDVPVGDPGFAREGHHNAGQVSRDKVSVDRPQGLVPEHFVQGVAVDRWEYGDPADPSHKPHMSAEALKNAINEEKVKKGEKPPADVKTTMTYNEGGNMLVGTMPDGQPYGVIGRDGLLHSVFHLQEQYDKDPTKVKKFADASVLDRVASMEKGKKFSTEEVDDTIARLVAIGKIPAGADKAGREKAAKEFLAKIDLVKDYFAEDTQIPREDLIFVAQPDFHIDMYMRPLAPGEIMINDYKENIKLLNEAMKKATQPWEKKQLQSMIDHATEMDKIMGPVIDKIEQQAGEGKKLKVVRAPGTMEGEVDEALIKTTEPMGRALGLGTDTKFTRTNLRNALFALFPGGSPPPETQKNIIKLLDEKFTRHVNFMNAIPGTKEGTNEQYYLTNYTSLKPLRDAYEDHLKRKGVEKIEWMGDDGGGQDTMSASERSLQQFGGLDCRENH